MNATFGTTLPMDIRMLHHFLHHPTGRVSCISDSPANNGSDQALEYIVPGRTGILRTWTSKKDMKAIQSAIHRLGYGFWEKLHGRQREATKAMY